jgi:hypothetical protein
MIERDYANSPYKNVVVGFHVSFVIFLLIEILFNYYMCVTTRNTGANYDKVVRELATVTNFVYPETPQDVASFRRDFNDKMMLRMKRRHEREMNYQHAPAVIISEVDNSDGAKVTSMTVDTPTMNGDVNNNGDIENNTNNGTTTSTADGSVADASSTDPTIVTKRKNINVKSSSSKTKTKTTTTVKKQPTPQQMRNWMLMAPDEWGYCSRSNQPKPPRSHYDHVTKTLVLCLDHYCPWMFNVGTLRDTFVAQNN